MNYQEYYKKIEHSNDVDFFKESGMAIEKFATLFKKKEEQYRTKEKLTLEKATKKLATIYKRDKKVDDHIFNFLKNSVKIKELSSKDNILEQYNDFKIKNKEEIENLLRLKQPIVEDDVKERLGSIYFIQFCLYFIKYNLASEMRNKQKKASLKGFNNISAYK